MDRRGFPGEKRQPAPMTRAGAGSNGEEWGKFQSRNAKVNASGVRGARHCKVKHLLPEDSKRPSGPAGKSWDTLNPQGKARCATGSETTGRLDGQPHGFH